jgi:aryl-alcohol dehydrogenase-like predicted oxidoreductase
VLSRGLIGGHYDPSKTAVNDFRAHSPRFQGDNLDRNLELVEALRRVAADTGISVAQAAIAWVASRGDDIVPVVGARTRERLAESLGADSVTLTSEQLAAIETAMPAEQVAGTRYAEAQMAMLDSER